MCFLGNFCNNFQTPHIFFITARQWSYGKVIFCRGVSLLRGGSHVTITHDALALTVPTIPLRKTWDLGTYLPSAAGRSVQTCSPEEHPPPQHIDSSQYPT